MSAAAEFRLVSDWHVDAPRERVWNALKVPTEWPRWWRYVARVDELARGDAEGIGARHRFHWTSRLPYAIDIEMDTVEVRPRESIRAIASGDLQGEGLWELGDTPTGTLARYTWCVGLDKAWMRALAPLLRAVFAWNHNAVMAAGEAGLRNELAPR
ncbi:MAG TPA: SRPBCC family protein [Xanthomonadales bacterium]|nr:SRPBCC family protein [Xanthomonadales bacterium]